MQLSSFASRNAAAVAMLGGFSLLVFACSDVTDVASPAVSQPQTSTNLVAEGSVYSAYWKPENGRLSFKGAVSVPVRILSKKGVEVASARGAGVGNSDAVFAEQLQHELSAFDLRTAGPIAAYAIKGGVKVTKSSMRFKSMVTKDVDGKTIKVAYAFDGDRKNGRPPKAIMIWENGRPVAIIQSRYAKIRDSWRATKARTLLLDGSGKVVSVLDQNQTVGTHTRASSTSSIFGRVLEGSGEALRLVANAVRPDVLYAAGTSEEQLGCWEEALAVALTAGAVALAAFGVTVAEAGVVAAHAALGVAIAACPGLTVACLPSVVAAELAVIAADKALMLAIGGLTSAIIAAQAAAAVLTACLIPDTQIGPGGGGEDACEGDDEEWCQWTVWTNGDGEVVSVEEDFCWCQDPRMT